MNRTRFIQGLNSNIELSDKERRRTIRNSINKRPWKLNCTIAMEEFAELTQQVSKQIRGYGDRIGLQKRWQMLIFVYRFWSPFLISHRKICRKRLM